MEKKYLDKTYYIVLKITIHYSSAVTCFVVHSSIRTNKEQIGRFITKQQQKFEITSPLSISVRRNTGKKTNVNYDS